MKFYLIIEKDTKSNTHNVVRIFTSKDKALLSLELTYEGLPEELKRNTVIVGESLRYKGIVKVWIAEATEGEPFRQAIEEAYEEAVYYSYAKPHDTEFAFDI